MSEIVVSLKSTRVDPFLKQQIDHSELDGRSLLCTQCGICTSGCPLGEYIKPHKIVRMVNLGLRDQLIHLREIWLCTTCFTCSQRCPQDVNPANIIFNLKNIASRHGIIPAGLREICRNILEEGRTLKITTGREREREKLGLPKTVPVNIEKIKRLLDKTRFDKILEGGKV